MSIKSFREIKEEVKNWWQQLQYERKCSSAYSVQKLVNNSSGEIQIQVTGFISNEIKTLMEKCRDTKNYVDYQHFCNAINGCFDNFVYAADAVKSLFSEIITFVNFGLNECRTRLHLKDSQKNTTMELLHSFSRILILILKLNRPQYSKKQKNIYFDYPVEDLNNIKGTQVLYSALTQKIGQFLMMDDVLIETKNNFAICRVLILEITNPDEKALVQFHKNFVETISATSSEVNSKLNVLKFLICSASINTWSVNIIDNDSTYHYLKFFIFLCEKYSSETSIVLNTSRTLFLLIKHESFKNFIINSDWEKVKEIISLLLGCIFMLLEHPVSCVRHSARHFLQLLANHSSLQSIMIDSVFQLPTDKRSYFISVGVLANEIGTDVLIKKNQRLPSQLISSLSDPTIISHVSLCLEFLILKDTLAKRDFRKWCEIWIVPLLVSLMKSLPIVGADIEKLLERAFKKFPNSVIYVLDKWANPRSEEELRYVITTLKISQKQGLKLSKNSSNSVDDNNKSKGDSDKMKSLINEKLLKQCLSQRDDDIRISAFSLLVEAHKTTKAYTENDFNLILYFLNYNLNNQQPATRQKILGLVRKMLVRFSDSKATFLKLSKNVKEEEEKSKNCVLYDDFMNSLLEFCFSNIFFGCNFNRLNTVLNILLLCLENVKNLHLKSERVVSYWEKLLIALDSSYEENKELAVVLAKKLDLSLLNANKTNEAKVLFEKAFNICSHMEPPDVLTGAYLLQLLINFPVSKKVLSEHFIENSVIDDVSFYCIQILTHKLREELHLARLDLMTAATCGPMYGVLFAVRLILKDFDFSLLQGNSEKLEHWGKILNDLVELSFKMTDIVGCVVNSSSPEGHLPNDFQTNFENLLSLNFDEQHTVDGLSDWNDLSSGNDSYIYLIKTSCSYFIKKFNNLISLIEKDNNDVYESLRRLKALLKENQLLTKKVENLRTKKNDQAIRELEETKIKLEIYIKKLEQTKVVPEWPASAQVLLLCAWRTIKEASLYLGDLVAKLPAETAIRLGLMTEDTLIRIGEKLKILLCEIKHRGAFEHAYIGFTQLVNSLWKCSNKKLNNLPKLWLEDIINELESPLEDQKMKLCSTRRSAGLPFLIQAIICSEIVSVKSSTPSSLHATMKSLLRIIEIGVPENPDSKIHALNILRALFKHAQLGEHVASYVSRGLMVALRGSRAATWSERNSSNLLFSSLMIRIFGVARSRDGISKKNQMTSRTFFQRYSELYDFLLSEMELVYSAESYVNGMYPKPSLYLILLILGRLYPPPAEDPENLDLSEFLPYINRSRKNPTMKIRELGARALVPLISLDRLWPELDDRFSLLSLRSGISQNERHGILLQIKELLSQSSDCLKNITKGNLEISWVENSKWMLNCTDKLSFVLLTSYVNVLHILFNNFPLLRKEIAHVMNSASLAERLFGLSNTELSVLPGVHVHLQSFCLLKTDTVAYRWMNSKDCGPERFLEWFLFMLNCGTSEVQSIPLRIFSYSLETNMSSGDFKNDDFSGIGVPIDDLIIFQSNENIKKLKKDILYNAVVLKSLTEPLNAEDCEFFKSKIIHRSWLSAISTLVMNDKISISHSVESGLRIDFIKHLIKSGDKGLSTSALICYAVYLMEEVTLTAERGMVTKDRFELSDILEEYSESEADVRERLAVAGILNRLCGSFIRKIAVSDSVIMSIWMIPFKLLADEDPVVRSTAAEIVYKLQEHILSEPSHQLIIQRKTFGSLYLPSVPLMAQENLLDAYVNILGEENLLHLVVQMLRMALSSCNKSDAILFAKDEFGVFEKGNPNPYCEDLALSGLMCRKLAELNSLINLKTLLWTELDAPSRGFLSERFQLSDVSPRNLMEVLEAVTTFVEDNQKLKGNFSLPGIQVQNLKNALSLQ